VVFFGNELDPGLCLALEDHYTEEKEGLTRWKRLEKNQLWVLPDLQTLFTDWPSILDAMRAHLKSAEENADHETYSVMVETRLLHMQTRTLTDLRESLRMYHAIVKHAIKLIGKYDIGAGGHFKLDMLYSKDDFDLLYRLRAIDDQMSYSLITINTISEQLQNLLQMVRLITTIYLR
jgi:hypothetical protein